MLVNNAMSKKKISYTIEFDLSDEDKAEALAAFLNAIKTVGLPEEKDEKVDPKKNNKKNNKE